MEVILRIGSTTRTVRARRVLSAVSVYAKMVKTDSRGTDAGCTWGLKIDRQDIYTAQNALEAQGIRYEIL